MADNHAQSTFTPNVPKQYVTPEDLKLFTDMRVSYQDVGDKWYLFAEDHLNEEEHSEDELFAALQEIIIRSNGELKYISCETAYTCSRMCQGEFGGAAAFIVADNIEYFGTGTWLGQKIAEVQ